MCDIFTIIALQKVGGNRPDKQFFSFGKDILRTILAPTKELNPNTLSKLPSVCAFLKVKVHISKALQYLCSNSAPATPTPHSGAF